MCCRCINSCGNDRIGCVLVPVHSMIVDETLEFLEIIMIFALDKCNDVVMGSWGITGYVNVSIFIPECGGPSVDSFGIVCTMWVRRLRNILRVPSLLLCHAPVKIMMYFHVYYYDSVIESCYIWMICCWLKYKIKCTFLKNKPLQSNDKVALKCFMPFFRMNFEEGLLGFCFLVV